MGVYCVADHGMTCLKVGFTKSKTDANARIKTLQTSCPFKLRILAFCGHMTQRDEKYIHGIIRHYRLNGGTEWFSYDSIDVVAKYMKFDKNNIESQQTAQSCSRRTEAMELPLAEFRDSDDDDTDEDSAKTWALLGITKGKEPYYSDDENDEQGDTDDTDFCPVLDECITEYASQNGILSKWLNWPDSHFGKFPDLYRKFLPRDYQPITYSQLAKHLVLGTQGENWNPSEVMAKIVANQLCSAHFWPESNCGDEIEAYPLLNEKKPRHLLMMCFAEPKDCINDIEVFIDEFFWTLDSYIMGMSFLIIDKTHNYYEATHQHPLTQLTRQEINRLRFGDMAIT